MSTRKGLVSAAFVAVGLAFSGSVLAQAMPEAGWYAGASIGQSSVDIDCDGATSCDDKDTAWKILGGYRITRNFAVEVGYANLGEASASGPGFGITFESTVWELLGVGSFPVSGQFSLYGKAGLFRGEVDTRATLGPLSGSLSETTTDLTFGFGAQFDVTPQLGIRAEWQRYTNMGDNATIGESDVDVISLGAVVRF